MGWGNEETPIPTYTAASGRVGMARVNPRVGGQRLG